MHEEQLHTDFYDLGRIFNMDWMTTVLVWLRDGPQRPRDLEEFADDWEFYDRWKQAWRALTRYHIRNALAALVDVGLVEKQRSQSGRFEHQVEYSLTAAGEALLVELEHLRVWLRQHPSVLDDAVHLYHQKHAS